MLPPSQHAAVESYATSRPLPKKKEYKMVFLRTHWSRVQHDRHAAVVGRRRILGREGSRLKQACSLSFPFASWRRHTVRERRPTWCGVTPSAGRSTCRCRCRFTGLRTEQAPAADRRRAAGCCVYSHARRGCDACMRVSTWVRKGCCRGAAR